MLVAILRVVIVSLMILFLGLFCHELGHLAYFKHVLHKKVKLKLTSKGVIVGIDKDYKDLNNKQYYSLLFWGVWFGAISIIIISLLINSYFLGLLFAYFFFCISDLKNIYNTWGVF